jgi:hypothetical protein
VIDVCYAIEALFGCLLHIVCVEKLFEYCCYNSPEWKMENRQGQYKT